MREGLYLWSKRSPGKGWRKIATRHGMSGWTNYFWYKRGRA